MEKKILSIIFCTMLIATAISSAVGNGVNDNLTLMETSNDYNRLIQQLISSSCYLGEWSEQDKLNASDGANGDYFGIVSISGDYALIGALEDTNRGSAYVFKRDGTNWTEEAKLKASDGESDDHFGVSVSLSGDYAVIGADEDDSDRGSAYVFKRDGTSWTEEAKLNASDGESGDYFGVSVSLSGDYALIGAVGDDSERGSAYVFKRDGTNWLEEAKLNASDGYDDDFFCTVSIDGDYALIGAFYDDLRGSAYVFKRDGTSWTEEDKLNASDGESGDIFGHSVCISGDYALIGAPRDDNYKGSTYVFKRDGTSWIEEAKLVASDGEEFGDYFGVSVSLSGDYALIGAGGDDFERGSAYVFKCDGTNWTEVDKLVASDGESGDWFGGSVSLSGDYALIGAYSDDSYRGSAYIFVRNPPPNKPNINGPSFGKTGILYAYSLISEDPDDEDVFYEIDWDDGSVEPWDGPFESNTFVIKNHTWEESGIYFIRGRAKDVNGTISEWVTHMMIVFISFESPFLKFLQDFLLSHPNILIILRMLIRMFGIQ
jgi:hypothetical protein